MFIIAEFEPQINTHFPLSEKRSVLVRMHPWRSLMFVDNVSGRLIESPY